jgi:NADH-quinone oxidoreductase subunit I
MTFLERFTLCDCKGLILLPSSIYLLGKLLLSRQVRVMSPVYRGQHIFETCDEQRKIMLVGFILSTNNLQSGREKMRNIYREEKYASIYEINMLRCILWFMWKACPKMLFDSLKYCSFKL